MTAFITAKSRLPVPSARKAAPQPQSEVQLLADSTCFASGKLENIATVQECLDDSRFLLFMRDCDFHDRGAGRHHHAIVICADHVARLDGNAADDDQPIDRPERLLDDAFMKSP